MKNKLLLIAALALGSLTGCVKVEDEVYKCKSTKAGPGLLYTYYTKNIGEQLPLYISDYTYGSNSNTEYIVTAPNDSTYSSKDYYPIPVYITGPDTGEFTYTVTSTAAGCVSKETAFKVRVTANVPNCISSNRIYVNNNVYSTGVPTATSNYNNYIVQWNLSSSSYYTLYATITFRTPPPTNGTTIYNVVDKQSDYLGSNECSFFYYTNGSTYDGTKGAIYVTYENGKYTATFCDLPCTYGYYSYNVTADGNLQFYP